MGSSRKHGDGCWKQGLGLSRWKAERRAPSARKPAPSEGEAQGTSENPRVGPLQGLLFLFCDLNTHTRSNLLCTHITNTYSIIYKSLEHWKCNPKHTCLNANIWSPKEANVYGVCNLALKRIKARVSTWTVMFPSTSAKLHSRFVKCMDGKNQRDLTQCPGFQRKEPGSREGGEVSDSNKDSLENSIGRHGGTVSVI